MAADHLQFLKDKFLRDLQEAVEEFEKLPLRTHLEEVAEVLLRRSIRASTPIAMKNGLYDLRYLLAECVIWAEQERDRKSKSQNKKIKIDLDAWHVKKLWFLYKTRKKLRRIRKELEGMRDEAVRSNISPSLSTEAIRVFSVGDSLWLPGRYARQVHGLEDKLQTIKALLLCQSPNYAAADDGWKVVGIVGMGGVGKTMLARMFADDYQATRHYAHFIWVRCSKETKFFDIEKSLSEILYNLHKANDPDDDDDDDVSSGCCDQSLLGSKRYLILIDNVCNLGDWQACSGTSATRFDGWFKPLSRNFPRGSGGAIIVTTRFQELGRSMAGDNNLVKLEPHYSADHLWSMFMDSIRRKGFLLPDHHRTILGMKDEIVDRCDGLPLAARTLAEVISTQLGKRKYWSNSTREKTIGLRVDEPDEISFLKIEEVLKIYPGVTDVYTDPINKRVMVTGELDVVELAREFGKFWQTELVSVD